MPKRNLTVRLDDDLVRQAKVLAAKRGTSVSVLVADVVKRLVAAYERYEDSHRRAMRALGAATNRGGRAWRRDQLHER
jgi:predicted transcriptional regulator